MLFVCRGGDPERLSYLSMARPFVNIPGLQSRFSGKKLYMCVCVCMCVYVQSLAEVTPA